MENIDIKVKTTDVEDVEFGEAHMEVEYGQRMGNETELQMEEGERTKEADIGGLTASDVTPPQTETVSQVESEPIAFESRTPFKDEKGLNISHDIPTPPNTVVDNELVPDGNGAAMTSDVTSTQTEIVSEVGLVLSDQRLIPVPSISHSQECGSELEQIALQNRTPFKDEKGLNLSHYMHTPLSTIVDDRLVADGNGGLSQNECLPVLDVMCPVTELTVDLTCQQGAGEITYSPSGSSDDQSAKEGSTITVPPPLCRTSLSLEDMECEAVSPHTTKIKGKMTDVEDVEFGEAHVEVEAFGEAHVEVEEYRQRMGNETELQMEEGGKTKGADFGGLTASVVTSPPTETVSEVGMVLSDQRILPVPSILHSQECGSKLDQIALERRTPCKHEKQLKFSYDMPTPPYTIVDNQLVADWNEAAMSSDLTSAQTETVSEVGMELSDPRIIPVPSISHSQECGTESEQIALESRTPFKDEKGLNLSYDMPTPSNTTVDDQLVADGNGGLSQNECLPVLDVMCPVTELTVDLTCQQGAGEITYSPSGSSDDQSAKEGSTITVPPPLCRLGLSLEDMESEAVSPHTTKIKGKMTDVEDVEFGEAHVEVEAFGEAHVEVEEYRQRMGNETELQMEEGGKTKGADFGGLTASVLTSPQTETISEVGTELSDQRILPVPSISHSQDCGSESEQIVSESRTQFKEKKELKLSYDMPTPPNTIMDNKLVVHGNGGEITLSQSKCLPVLDVMCPVTELTVDLTCQQRAGERNNSQSGSSDDQLAKEESTITVPPPLCMTSLSLEDMESEAVSPHTTKIKGKMADVEVEEFGEAHVEVEYGQRMGNETELQMEEGGRTKRADFGGLTASDVTSAQTETISEVGLVLFDQRILPVSSILHSQESGSESEQISLERRTLCKQEKQLKLSYDMPTPNTIVDNQLVADWNDGAMRSDVTSAQTETVSEVGMELSDPRIIPVPSISHSQECGTESEQIALGSRTPFKDEKGLNLSYDMPTPSNTTVDDQLVADGNGGLSQNECLPVLDVICPVTELTVDLTCQQGAGEITYSTSGSSDDQSAKEGSTITVPPPLCRPGLSLEDMESEAVSPHTTKIKGKMTDVEDVEFGEAHVEVEAFGEAHVEFEEYGRRMGNETELQMEEGGKTKGADFGGLTASVVTSPQTETVSEVGMELSDQRILPVPSISHSQDCGSESEQIVSESRTQFKEKKELKLSYDMPTPPNTIMDNKLVVHGNGGEMTLNQSKCLPVLDVMCPVTELTVDLTCQQGAGERNNSQSGSSDEQPAKEGSTITVPPPLCRTSLSLEDMESEAVSPHTTKIKGKMTDVEDVEFGEAHVEVEAFGEAHVEVEEYGRRMGNETELQMEEGGKTKGADFGGLTASVVTSPPTETVSEVGMVLSDQRILTVPSISHSQECGSKLDQIALERRTPCKHEKQLKLSYDMPTPPNTIVDNQLVADWNEAAMSSDLTSAQTETVSEVGMELSDPRIIPVPSISHSQECGTESEQIALESRTPFKDEKGLNLSYDMPTPSNTTVDDQLVADGNGGLSQNECLPVLDVMCPVTELTVDLTCQQGAGERTYSPLGSSDDQSAKEGSTITVSSPLCRPGLSLQDMESEALCPHTTKIKGKMTDVEFGEAHVEVEEYGQRMGNETELQMEEGGRTKGSNFGGLTASDVTSAQTETVSEVGVVLSDPRIIPVPSISHSQECGSDSKQIALESRTPFKDEKGFNLSYDMPTPSNTTVDDQLVADGNGGLSQNECLPALDVMCPVTELTVGLTCQQGAGERTYSPSGSSDDQSAKEENTITVPPPLCRPGLSLEDMVSEPVSPHTTAPLHPSLDETTHTKGKDMVDERTEDKAKTSMGLVDAEEKIEALPLVNFPTSEQKLIESEGSSLSQSEIDKSLRNCHTFASQIPNRKHPKTDMCEPKVMKEQISLEPEIKRHRKKGRKKSAIPAKPVSCPQEWDAGPFYNCEQDNPYSLIQDNVATEQRHIGTFNQSTIKRKNLKMNREIRDTSIDVVTVGATVSPEQCETVLDSNALQSQPSNILKKGISSLSITEVSGAGHHAVDSLDVKPEERFWQPENSLKSLMEGAAVAGVPNCSNSGKQTADISCQALTDSSFLENAIPCAVKPVGNVTETTVKHAVLIGVEDEKRLIDSHPDYGDVTQSFEVVNKFTGLDQEVLRKKKKKKRKPVRKKRGQVELEVDIEPGEASTSGVVDKWEIHSLCKNDTEMQISQHVSIAQDKEEDAKGKSPACLRENENTLSSGNIYHHNSQINKTKKGRKAKRLTTFPPETSLRRYSSTCGDISVDPPLVPEKNLYQSPTFLTVHNELEANSFVKEKPCRNRRARKNKRKSQAVVKDLGNQEPFIIIHEEEGGANGGVTAVASNAPTPNDTVLQNIKKRGHSRKKIFKEETDGVQNLQTVSEVISNSFEQQSQNVDTEGIFQTSTTKKNVRKPKKQKLIFRVSPLELEGNEMKAEKEGMMAVTFAKEEYRGAKERPEGLKISGTVGKFKRKPGRPYKKTTLREMAKQLNFAEEQRSDESDLSTLTELRKELLPQDIMSHLPQSCKVKKINKKVKQALSPPVTNLIKHSGACQLSPIEKMEEYFGHDHDHLTMLTGPEDVQKGRISSSAAGLSVPEASNKMDSCEFFKEKPRRQKRPTKKKAESQAMNSKDGVQESLLTVHESGAEANSTIPNKLVFLKQQKRGYPRKKVLKEETNCIPKNVQTIDNSEKQSHSISQQALASSSEIKTDLEGPSILTLKKNVKKPRKQKCISTIFPKGLIESTENETDMTILDTTNSLVIQQQAEYKMMNTLPQVNKHRNAEDIIVSPESSGTVTKSKRKISRVCKKKTQKRKMARELAVEQGSNSVDASADNQLEKGVPLDIPSQQVKKCKTKKVSKKVKSGSSPPLTNIKRCSRAGKIPSIDKMEHHCAHNPVETILLATSSSASDLTFPKREMSPSPTVPVVFNKASKFDERKPLRQGRQQKRGKKPPKKEDKGQGGHKPILVVHEHEVGASPVCTTTGTAELIPNSFMNHNPPKCGHPLKKVLKEETVVIQENVQTIVDGNLFVQQSCNVPAQTFLPPSEIKNDSAGTFETSFLSIKKKIKKSRVQKPSRKITPEVMFESIEPSAELSQGVAHDIIIPQQSECETFGTVPQVGKRAQSNKKKRKAVKEQIIKPTSTLGEARKEENVLAILQTGGAIAKVKRKRGRPYKKQTLIKMAKQLEFIEEQRLNGTEITINQLENDSGSQVISSHQAQAYKQRKTSKKVKLASPPTPIAHLRRSSRACKVTTDYTFDKTKDNLENDLNLSSAYLSDTCPSFSELGERDVKQEIIGSVETVKTSETVVQFASEKVAPSEVQSLSQEHSNIKTLESSTLLNSTDDTKVHEDPTTFNTLLSLETGITPSFQEIVELNCTDLVTKRPRKNKGSKKKGKRRRRTWWDERGKAKPLLCTTLATALETSQSEGRLETALEDKIPDEQMYNSDTKLLILGQRMHETYSDSGRSGAQLYDFHSEKADWEISVGEEPLANGEYDVQNASQDLEDTTKMDCKSPKSKYLDVGKEQDIAHLYSQNAKILPKSSSSVGGTGTIDEFLPQKPQKETEETTALLSQGESAVHSREQQTTMEDRVKEGKLVKIKSIDGLEADLQPTRNLFEQQSCKVPVQALVPPSEMNSDSAGTFETSSLSIKKNINKRRELKHNHKISQEVMFESIDPSAEFNQGVAHDILIPQQSECETFGTVTQVAKGAQSNKKKRKSVKEQIIKPTSTLGEPRKVEDVLPILQTSVAITKVKRKPGRPYKKNKLKKMAKQLSFIEEQRLNGTEIAAINQLGTDSGPQEICFHQAQACKQRKTSKKIKLASPPAPTAHLRRYSRACKVATDTFDKTTDGLENNLNLSSSKYLSDTLASFPEMDVKQEIIGSGATVKTSETVVQFASESIGHSDVQRLSQEHSNMKTLESSTLPHSPEDTKVHEDTTTVNTLLSLETVIPPSFQATDGRNTTDLVTKKLRKNKSSKKKGRKRRSWWDDRGKAKPLLRTTLGTALETFQDERLETALQEKVPNEQMYNSDAKLLILGCENDVQNASKDLETTAKMNCKGQEPQDHKVGKEQDIAHVYSQISKVLANSCGSMGDTGTIDEFLPQKHENKIKEEPTTLPCQAESTALLSEQQTTTEDQVEEGKLGKVKSIEGLETDLQSTRNLFVQQSCNLPVQAPLPPSEIKNDSAGTSSLSIKKNINKRREQKHNHKISQEVMFESIDPSAELSQGVAHDILIPQQSECETFGTVTQVGKGAQSNKKKRKAVKEQIIKTTSTLGEPSKVEDVLAILKTGVAITKVKRKHSRPDKKKKLKKMAKQTFIEEHRLNVMEIAAINQLKNQIGPQENSSHEPQASKQRKTSKKVKLASIPTPIAHLRRYSRACKVTTDYKFDKTKVSLESNLNFSSSTYLSDTHASFPEMDIKQDIIGSVESIKTSETFGQFASENIGHSDVQSLSQEHSNIKTVESSAFPIPPEDTKVREDTTTFNTLLSLDTALTPSFQEIDERNGKDLVTKRPRKNKGTSFLSIKKKIKKRRIQKHNRKKTPEIMFESIDPSAELSQGVANDILIPQQSERETFGTVTRVAKGAQSNKKKRKAVKEQIIKPTSTLGEARKVEDVFAILQTGGAITKVKRKRGRPFKKKTLENIAKQLAIIEEQRLNGTKITINQLENDSGPQENSSHEPQACKQRNINKKVKLASRPTPIAHLRRYSRACKVTTDYTFHKTGDSLETNLNLSSSTYLSDTLASFPEMDVKQEIIGSGATVKTSEMVVQSASENSVHSEVQSLSQEHSNIKTLESSTLLNSPEDTKVQEDTTTFNTLLSVDTATTPSFQEIVELNSTDLVTKRPRKNKGSKKKGKKRRSTWWDERGKAKPLLCTTLGTVLETSQSEGKLETALEGKTPDEQMYNSDAKLLILGQRMHESYSDSGRSGAQLYHFHSEKADWEISVGESPLANAENDVQNTSEDLEATTKMNCTSQESKDQEIVKEQGIAHVYSQIANVLANCCSSVGDTGTIHEFLPKKPEKETKEEMTTLLSQVESAVLSREPQKSTEDRAEEVKLEKLKSIEGLEADPQLTGNLFVQQSCNVPEQALLPSPEIKNDSAGTFEASSLSIKKRINKRRVQKPNRKITPEVMFESMDPSAELNQGVAHGILIPEQSECETFGTVTQVAKGAQSNIKKRKSVKEQMIKPTLTLGEPRKVEDVLAILQTSGASTKVKRKRSRPYKKKKLRKMAKQTFIEEQRLSGMEIATINQLENHSGPQENSSHEPQASKQMKTSKKVKIASPPTPVAHLRRYSRACKVTTDYTFHKTGDGLETNLNLSSSTYLSDTLASFSEMGIKQEIIGSGETMKTSETVVQFASENIVHSEVQSLSQEHSNIKILESSTLLNSPEDTKVNEDTTTFSTLLSVDTGMTPSFQEIVELKPLLCTTLGTVLETSQSEGRLETALEGKTPDEQMYNSDTKLLILGQRIPETHSDYGISGAQLYDFHSERADREISVGQGSLANGENDVQNAFEDLEATTKMNCTSQASKDQEMGKEQGILHVYRQIAKALANSGSSVGDTGTIAEFLQQKPEKEAEEEMTKLLSPLESTILSREQQNTTEYQLEEGKPVKVKSIDSLEIDSQRTENLFEQQSCNVPPEALMPPSEIANGSAGTLETSFPSTNKKIKKHRIQKPNYKISQEVMFESIEPSAELSQDDTIDILIPQQRECETFGTITQVDKGAQSNMTKTKTVNEQIIKPTSTLGEPRKVEDVLAILQTGGAITKAKRKRSRPYKKKKLKKMAKQLAFIVEQRLNGTEIAAVNQLGTDSGPQENSSHEPQACKQRRSKKVKLASPSTPIAHLRRYSRACKVTTDYKFGKTKDDLEDNLNLSPATYLSDTLPSFSEMDVKEDMLGSVSTMKTSETVVQFASENIAHSAVQSISQDNSDIKTMESSCLLNSSEDTKVHEDATTFSSLPSLDTGITPFQYLVTKKPLTTKATKKRGKKRRRTWWDERGKRKPLLHTSLGTSLAIYQDKGRLQTALEDKIPDEQMHNSDTKLLILGQSEKYSDSDVCGAQLHDFLSKKADCEISVGQGPVDNGKNDVQHASEDLEATTDINCKSQESNDQEVGKEQDIAHVYSQIAKVLANSCSSVGDTGTIDEFLPQKPEADSEEQMTTLVESTVLSSEQQNTAEDRVKEGKLIEGLEADLLPTAGPLVHMQGSRKESKPQKQSVITEPRVLRDRNRGRIKQDAHGANLTLVGASQSNCEVPHTALESKMEGARKLEIEVISTESESSARSKAPEEVLPMKNYSEAFLNHSGMEEQSLLIKDVQRGKSGIEMKDPPFSEACSSQSSLYKPVGSLDQQMGDEEKQEERKGETLEDADKVEGNNHEGEPVEKMTGEPKLTANPSELQVSACLTKKDKFPAKCHFCGRSFRHITAYIIHRRIHTGVKPYRCQECGKTFAQLSDLNVHKKVHKLPGHLQCPLCTSRFSLRDKLLAHFLTHTNYLHQKNLIGESANDSYGIKAKINTRLSRSAFSMQDVKPFKCINCGKQFRYSVTLRKHTCIQRKDKPFSCNVCDKAFNRASKLSDHEKIHWPVKPFSCNVCGKGFSQLGALKTHSRTHTGEKPFSCARCGNAFLQLSSLRAHQASKLCLSKGMGEDVSNGFIEDFVLCQSLEGQVNLTVSFECHICSKSYDVQSEYNLHLLTHSDVQTSVCDACGQRFNKNSDHKAHRQICSRLNTMELHKTSPSQVSDASQLRHNQPAQSPDHLQKLPLNNQQSKCKNLLVTQSENTLRGSVTQPQNSSDSPELLDIHQSSSTDSTLVSTTTSRSNVPSCEIYKSPKRIQAHMLTSTPRYSYTCGRCGKVLETWNKYWLHQRVHWKKPGGFCCPQCNKHFYFHGLYKEHMLEHAKHNPYACPLCPIAFADKEGLMDHQRVEHRACKTHKCHTCGKCFVHLRNLERHNPLHRGARPRRRSLGSRFRSGGLPQQLTTNSPSRPLPDMPADAVSLHTCGECDANFRTLDLLVVHQLCHSTGDGNPQEDGEIVAGSLAPLHQQQPGSTPSPTPVLSSSSVVTPDQHASLYAYPHPDDLYVYPTPSTSFPPPVLPSVTNVLCYRKPSQMNTSKTKPLASLNTSHSYKLPVNKEQVQFDHPYSAPPLAGPAQSSSHSTSVSFSTPQPLKHPPQPHMRNPLQLSTNRLSLHTSCAQPSPIAQINRILFGSDGDSRGDVSRVPLSYVKLKNKEEIQESLGCAECGTEFGAVSELYEHYIQHARGEL